MTSVEGNILFLLLAFGAWGVGGWLLAGQAFWLYRHERLVIGLAFGIVAANWLANLFAQGISLPHAFWLASLILLLSGVAASRPWMNPGQLVGELKAAVPYLIWLLILVFVFTMAGRGLSIFDEFQTIPLVSLLAAGEVPPRFVLNPEIHFGYHYFLLLFAAQVMRLGDVFPWLALDFARSIVLAITILLGVLWAYRVTRSTLAGYLTGTFLLFAVGVRWLLLLFPSGLLSRISESVQMIGSGAASGETLRQALIGSWAIEGDGPIPFPFAFANGISPSFAMTYNGIGLTAVLILFLLFLTGDRRRNFLGGVLLVIALSSLALANEVTFAMLYLGALAVVVIRIFQGRSWSLPASLWPYVLMFAAAGVIALLQGGMFTEMARSTLAGMLGQPTESFYSNEFTVVWPPEVISIHMGRLVLSNPYHLIVALFEYGPVLIVLPLVAVRMWKSVERGKWVQASFWMSGLVTVIAWFVVYTGSAGISSTNRILEGLLFVCRLAFVPLLLLWLRGKHLALQYGAVSLGLLAILGGLVHFGISLTASAKPVNTFFISDMDSQILANQWNRLEPDALVFDPDPVRAVTVLGRYSHSSLSWGQTRQEWEQLLAAPDPYALRDAGFSYVYYDIAYWEQLPDSYQNALSASCVKQIDRVDGIRSEKDYRRDYRILLDIQSCQR
jgi:hypothetical protein